MLARITSAAVHGVEAVEVAIEVHVSQGLKKTVIVGLPDTAVKEAAERVQAALRNSGFRYPETHTTVNLAPADLRKEGPAFDLPIALGVVACTMVGSSPRFGGTIALGELALDGAVRPVKGVLAVAIEARRLGCRRLIVPSANATEAALVQGLDVVPVESLRQAWEILVGAQEATVFHLDRAAFIESHSAYAADFTDVKGQQTVKRALEVAVAGFHNVLMIGPPGTGKSMLASRLPTIMPQLSEEEAIEVTKIHSIAGLLDPKLGFLATRPFRSPHHTISEAGLLGGSGNPRPGEVSLAHLGVLFLDELPEFKRGTLEVMRQPLEDGKVTISRAAASLTFPARFMLVAAMNPCPCGYYGDPKHECRCSPRQIDQYRQRISGPLLDRIDLHVEVPQVAYRDLKGGPAGEPSAAIRARVERAREVQQRRYDGLRVRVATRTNSSLPPKLLQQHCRIDAEGARFLEGAMMDFHLSARAHDRILKVARTLADLAGSEPIRPEHVLEAIQFRSLDRRLQW